MEFKIINKYLQISIHAPAKGATETKESVWEDLAISIHAPAKGATIASADTERRFLFQSTPPRRERPEVDISAPQLINFNPRPREGSDRATLKRYKREGLFQSTPPRRERQRKVAPFMAKID